LAEHVVATLTCAASPEQETALGILRSTGISHNASTSAYETCFFAAGTTDDLERTWIPMLGAAIASPNLGARCVETERSAALDEMYAVRASCAVTDGKLDTYVASVEAPGSWQTRVDDDIAYLERESTERVAAAIGAFIAEYYCSARMHVTVASADADRLLNAVRRFVLPRPSGLGAGLREDRKPVLPRAVYKWTNWEPGSVSVIEGSAGDTTRVRFCASVNVSSDPVSVLAASCAAWCVAQMLFVELRVRSNAVYSVHAALDLRASFDAPDLHVYTFGSPRVDGNFQRAFPGTVHGPPRADQGGPHRIAVTGVGRRARVGRRDGRARGRGGHVARETAAGSGPRGRCTAARGRPQPAAIPVPRGWPGRGCEGL
jgi:hypothetical protein